MKEIDYQTRGHHIPEPGAQERRDGAKDLACTRCGNLPTKKGHDWCLRNMPGVLHACCGHGEQDGYIMFQNGVTIKGPFTVEQGIERHRGEE